MSANRKILVIDDNRDIHRDFRKIFKALQSGSRRRSTSWKTTCSASNRCSMPCGVR